MNSTHLEKSAEKGISIIILGIILYLRMNFTPLGKALAPISVKEEGMVTLFKAVQSISHFLF